MAMEDENKITRKKKNKKARKDKWGQPIPTATAEVDKEEEQEQVEETECPLSSGGGGDDEESYELNKVVASGMPYSVTEQEIRDLFEEFGPIEKLQLSRFPDSGNFRGLAFITFQTGAAALSSLKLDGFSMGNRFMKVERCRVDSKRKRKSEFLSDPEKVDGCLSAYIGNLSWDVTETDIRDCFKSSNIASIRFSFDKRTGISRGFCHVDFEDDESLEKAMKKNQAELHGRPMKIAYAVSSRN
ncbi:phragmoplastin interacting protein 1-like [Typha angustifolia]|uniref:phragmoplastin interacting protein 1-like n=1 Tax=Typha angustifolia TaxID=59011 RepID=UPI003C2F6ABE